LDILITGGAGFVGSSLARSFKKKNPQDRVVAFDNLRRRGSELNVAAFRREGIEFVHGDIRCPSDLEDLKGFFDVFVEASAEPSVHAGMDGSPAYVLSTNLGGTLHCLDFARRRAGAFIFLSTSRVYSIEPMRAIPLSEGKTRFDVAGSGDLPGLKPEGISEAFPTHLPRSFYGAAKLSSELAIQEYASSYGLKAVINRCGVIAGPGQFGKVDQGVFTLWVANHHYGKPLKYIGFGGQGKQVRDLMHPDDLFDLLQAQLSSPQGLRGGVYNAGGGLDVSASLLEMTALCQKVTGRSIPIASEPKTADVDVPWYVSDTAKVRAEFGWKPKRTVLDIVGDIHGWIKDNEAELRSVFA
jgi:CDP-paratose 2-epimerase